MDKITLDNLYLQIDDDSRALRVRALVVGEVLWDRFADATRLGGAPLNFAVHLHEFGHDPRIASAVGADALGALARSAMTALGLDTTLLQTSDRFPTGTARVQLGPGDATSFVIERPAAYDAMALTDADIRQIVEWRPDWMYYGTLFPSEPGAQRLLSQVSKALSDTARFYDLNLRPGFESPELVRELLQTADAVKLNEREFDTVRRMLDLPADPEGFCRAGAALFGWRAACVTFGARGCALRVDGDYTEAPGVPVVVADSVGAGDAFAAAFLHGLASGWPVDRIAAFANRAGALVASSPGAIPSAASDDPVPVTHDGMRSVVSRG